jgi:hypothetical protein
MACAYCGEKGHNRTTCPKRRADEAVQAASGLAQQSKPAADADAKYLAAPWEKVVVLTVAMVIVLLVAFLVVRNEPFADPNLVVILRIFVSLSAAVLGATIPGFLHIGWDGAGLSIRAGGALALFVLTYVLSPAVVREEKPPAGFSEYSKRLEWRKVAVAPAMKDERFQGIETKIKGKFVTPEQDREIRELRDKYQFNWNGKRDTVFMTRELTDQPLPRKIALPKVIPAALILYGQARQNGRWSNKWEDYSLTNELDLSGFQPKGPCIFVLVVVPLNDTFYQKLQVPNTQLDDLLEVTW